jgi:preprotein translocase subunit SecA
MGLLTAIFGTKHEKDVKLIRPLVELINERYDAFNSLTDDELRAKTPEFREKIQSATSQMEIDKEALHNKLINEPLTASEISDVAEKIKKLDKEIFNTTQDILDEILPDAFAVVKQVCQRLTDAEFTYEYAGQHYKWDMVPYDVQLIGGVVIHQGKISEMATGEGKTLVAVAPVYLNALPGKGVHLITVNDYLAKRDCDWMRPVYEFLGLTCGAIQGNMDNVQRRKLYNMDITFGTNNEFGFDYLRDNMVTEMEHLVQRTHWFAIVDEVDSVLIDEARTPLIISGQVAQSDSRYEEINPRIRNLVQIQSSLVNNIVAKAQELLNSTNPDDQKEAGVYLLRANRGLPKQKRLMKLLQEPENQKLMKETELVYLANKGQKMHEIDDELYYIVEEKNNLIDLSEKGRLVLTSAHEDPEMFVIPDIAGELSAIEGNDQLTTLQKQLKRDEAYRIYADRSDRIHAVQQLLKAYTLFEKDVEYVIQESKIMIVDEFTGRIMDGRRYSDGLHQALEAKESVKVERDTQTLATITLQNYFRLYHKLSGMTGTADTEAAEFEKIYKLDVVVIPTNRPIVRDDQEDLIYKTTREKFNAVVDTSIELLKEGRAVLVGTANVEVSEILSKMFTRKKITHNVLNAKNHVREAEIIANAGRKGALTIATNMAGRGTDIKLDKDVKAAGGLAIIGSERHDARRIDRQLRGRSGRQGDPGSSIFFISLEDKLMRLFGGERVAGIMGKLKIPEGEPIQHSMISKSVEKAQKKVEENNFGVRKRLIEYDDVMNQQREVIYTRRRSALRGERLRGELLEYVEDSVMDWYIKFLEEDNFEGFLNTIRVKLLCDVKMTEDEFMNLNKTEIAKRVADVAHDFYQRKEDMIGSDFMAKLERVAVLQTIDDKWREHLRGMDDMKEGIHLRSYGQKDPLLEYKQEAYYMFLELIKDINLESASFAFRYFPQMVQETGEGSANVTISAMAPQLRNTNVTNKNLQFEHSSTTPSYVTQGMGVPKMQGPQGGQASTVTQTIKRTEKKIGRNDLVTVKFPNGKTQKVKYKKVEFDVEAGLCEIVHEK